MKRLLLLEGVQSLVIRILQRTQLLEKEFFLLATHLHLCRRLLLLRNPITEEKSITVALLADQLVPTALEQAQRDEHVQSIVDPALDVQLSPLLDSNAST